MTAARDLSGADLARSPAPIQAALAAAPGPTACASSGSGAL